MFIRMTLILFSIGLVSCSGPNKAWLVSGMQPQMELVREIVSEEGWKISCEGKSGEMTVLRIASTSHQSSQPQDYISEKLFKVASATTAVFGSDVVSEDCDTEPPRTSSDNSNQDSQLALGPEEKLQEYLEIAQSCGFADARIDAIPSTEAEVLEMEIPPNWLALYGGKNADTRYGPGVCYLMMSTRHKEANSAD